MKILLVQTGFLGDVILSSPVISCLAEQYPGAQISVLTTPLAKELVCYHPQVTETLVFDKRGADGGVFGLLRMARVLRAKEFSVVFSLHKSYRTALLLRLAGIKTRYGFSEASLSWMYSATASRKDLDHEVLRNLAILRNIGISPESCARPLRLEIPNDLKNYALKRLSAFSDRRAVIGIAPGSVWSTKRWTVEGFSTLAKELIKNGYGVVLVGGPADKEIGVQVEQDCGLAVLNLIGRTSILESAAVIDCLDLLVTNDSAPLHMASARQTPAVAIFCATVPEFGFGPWMLNSEIVEVKGLECRPCGRHGGNSCPTGTHACQKQITPAKVLAAVERLMASFEESQKEA